MALAGIRRLVVHIKAIEKDNLLFLQGAERKTPLLFECPEAFLVQGLGFMG